jgi:hypothetical protein
MGNDCFWPTKDVSMLEEEFVFLSKESIQEKGFSNSCRDHALSSSLRFEGFDVDEEINNMMNGTLQDKSDGYMCNIFMILIVMAL